MRTRILYLFLVFGFLLPAASNVQGRAAAYTRSTCIFFLFLCTASLVWAQQRPQYTQYIFNGSLMNPAVAGIERYVDVKLGGRSQWHGLEGAPQTAYLSAHLPIGARHIQDGAISFGEGGYNSHSRGYSHRYRSSEPHHGGGIIIQHNRAAQFVRTDALVAYAYHLRIAETMNLSAGVNAGVSQALGFLLNSRYKVYCPQVMF